MVHKIYIIRYEVLLFSEKGKLKPELEIIIKQNYDYPVFESSAEHMIPDDMIPEGGPGPVLSTCPISAQTDVADGKFGVQFEYGKCLAYEDTTPQLPTLQ